MFKIKRETDYGMVLAAYLARHGTQSAATLAQQLHLPLPLVSKVLKLMVKAGVLVSHRGACGGYQLARSAQQISAAELIAAFEGPIALTACTVALDQCAVSDHCDLSGHWQRINQAIYQSLAAISLAELSQPQTANQIIHFIPLQRAVSATKEMP